MNPLEAETLRLLEAIRRAKREIEYAKVFGRAVDGIMDAAQKRIEAEREFRKRQDLLYFRHREEGKR